jgi:hypothetical protein
MSNQAPNQNVKTGHYHFVIGHWDLTWNLDLGIWHFSLLHQIIILHNGLSIINNLWLF